jgi:SAM-dependent methyltransferase
MGAVGLLHDKLVFSRRAKVLATEFATVLPDALTVLDVGCGDGLIDRLICQQRPELSITGVDVLVRPQTHIAVQQFDGVHLPFEDKSFDVVLFTDVLHHTEDPEVLLREAKRVARLALVLKDHTKEGFLAYLTLRFMDWVGNARHGVALPYNYWTHSRWMSALRSLGLTVQFWKGALGLYPRPARWLFDRRLHFVARIAV